MPTEWRNLGNHTYALLSGSNIGAIVTDSRALIIDAGLNKDSAKKALRAIEEIDAQPTAILITHGHADHFGGAGWLAKRTQVPVYAPPLEGAFAAHPILEPLFLYGGAAPIAELRGRFTLAKVAAPIAGTLQPGPQEIADITVNIIPLPGHAPEQVGIGWNGTLFCGDAVFPEETLTRHPILFCADIDAWLETLDHLPTLAYDTFVPGHGIPVTDIAPLAAQNAARLREIRNLVLDTLAVPQNPHAILRAVAAHYHITFTAPQFFLLALTTIHAALTSLQSAGEAVIDMQDNHLLWRTT